MKRSVVAMLTAVAILGAAPVAEAGRRARNKVAHVRRTTYATTPQQLSAETAASERCRKWYSRAATINRRGHLLFAERIVSEGCYNGDRFTTKVKWDYQQYAGNQWWNLWRFKKTEQLVKGGGANPDGVPYRYRRWHTGWEACWEFCFMDWRMWASLTVRADGTYSNDKGEG
jgi:hypothetical protein